MTPIPQSLHQRRKVMQQVNYVTTQQIACAFIFPTSCKAEGQDHLETSPTSSETLPSTNQLLAQTLPTCP
eukprot:53214-Ditylum_brightwellii.AAC.1